MPNWCYNNLSVHPILDDPDEEDLKEMEDFQTKHSPTFSFSALAPLPEELKDTRSPSLVVPDDQLAKEIAKVDKLRATSPNPEWHSYPLSESQSRDYITRFGADNWYNWQNQNWGVKWDASDSESEHHDDCSHIAFQTPWGPPEEWLRLASETYPHLEFELTWEEEGGEHGGLLARDGDVSYFETEGPEPYEGEDDDFDNQSIGVVNKLNPELTDLRTKKK